MHPDAARAAGLWDAGPRRGAEPQSQGGGCRPRGLLQLRAENFPPSRSLGGQSLLSAFASQHLPRRAGKDFAVCFGKGAQEKLRAALLVQLPRCPAAPARCSGHSWMQPSPTCC